MVAVWCALVAHCTSVAIKGKRAPHYYRPPLHDLPGEFFTPDGTLLPPWADYA